MPRTVPEAPGRESSPLLSGNHCSCVLPGARRPAGGPRGAAAQGLEVVRALRSYGAGEGGKEGAGSSL